MLLDHPNETTAAGMTELRTLAAQLTAQTGQRVDVARLLAVIARASRDGRFGADGVLPGRAMVNPQVLAEYL